MSSHEPPLAALRAALGTAAAPPEPVAGGSINDAWRVALGNGAAAFVKARAGATAADFAAEAAGLEWLARADAVRVPRVVGRGETPPWLALEWIERGTLSPAGAEELGRGLAELHRAGAAAHGALPPGSPDRVLRLGSVHVGLRESGAWPELYAEQLLLPLARRARDAGTLATADAAAVEEVCGRLGELAGPSEPPARLHGDLWSGNLLADAEGRPWLVDPAAYGGHREIDLAMLRLFGAPSERIFAAYAEAYPLAPGADEREPLWQLLPLLVHAIIFGGGYGSRAGTVARRFTR